MNNATAVPKRSGSRRHSRLGALGLAGLALLGGMGCSSLLDNDALPKDVSDPAITQTPDGARAAYNGTLVQFRTAFGAGSNGNAASVIAATGLLTDELLDYASQSDVLDDRTMPEGVSAADNTYGDLHKVRGQAGQAIGLLATYLPDQPALAGHLYALEGYAELFLAEIFCSGIPLGTLDFQGDYTYRPGSTTEQVFAHAATLFDTALALAGDSTRFVQLARVGRARAQLALGNYAGAAATVAVVPTDYRYDVVYNNYTDPTGTGIGTARNFFNVLQSGLTPGNWNLTVPDHEGVNGMDWRTSGDPRTPIVARGTALNNFGTLYYPSRYDTLGASPIVLASGVEARLIEAEAALQVSSPTWLATLNALRTDGTFDVDTQVVAVDNSVAPPDTTFAYDTLWHAGSGGVAGLAPLADPGTANGRVDLLFRERAFWLFLTGHRQGDLRRLVRQYGRPEGDVYPVGPYEPGGGFFPYGGDVTVPIPTTEFVNPLYTGCASRGA